MKYTSKKFILRNRIINNYFKQNKIKKLHIGCGPNYLKEWLNGDIIINSNSDIYLDASKRLPFSSNLFNIIFSEQLIEHLDLKEALRHLRECHRILKPGGVLRISTPDLKFLVNLYNEKHKQNDKFVNYFFNNFVKKGLCSKTTVFNSFFMDHEHKIIFDYELLKRILEIAGFNNIKKCKIKESRIPDLKNIEEHETKYNEYLSFSVEALKP